jgi:hypothetical protein
MGKGTTEPGYRNRNGQVVIRPTHLAGTDHYQYIYVLRCGKCGHEYGANGSDIFQRRCPPSSGRRSGAPHRIASRFLSAATRSLGAAERTSWGRGSRRFDPRWR